MTTRDTPLTEVAALLPLHAALLLHQQAPRVQGTVMAALREALISWEAAGLDLDPVSREIIIDSFVRLDVTRVLWALDAITAAKGK